jgi:hypothetical protein
MDSMGGGVLVGISLGVMAVAFYKYMAGYPELF